MDYRQARLDLKKGKLHSLYLFSGSEDILKEEMLLEILDIMQCKGLEPDLLRIDGKRLGWQELCRELEQVTIFSRGRVLLVKDSPYFSNTPEKGTKALKKDPSKQKGRAQTEEPQQEELAALLNGGMSDTILVFFVQNVDKRKKVNKYLDNAGAMVEFPPLKGAALARWIRDELVCESKEIEDNALNILVQRSGENLALLKRELEKLVIWLGEEKKIDCSLVKKLVPENAQGSIFNLVDELGRKNAAGALNYLHMMRQQNEPPLRILTMVIRHFRLLYRASLLRQEGLTIAKIPATLQVHPFVAGKLLEQLPNFPGDSLPCIFNTLKEVDLMIKTGRLSGEEALEQLVLKLAFN